jgi:hypothetical protein
VLDIKEGDTLMAWIEEGEMRVTSTLAAMRRSRERLSKLIPAGVSLVDELLEERREEAARENGSGERG